jgi:hypothetical protein
LCGDVISLKSAFSGDESFSATNEKKEKEKKAQLLATVSFKQGGVQKEMLMRGG